MLYIFSVNPHFVYNVYNRTHTNAATSTRTSFINAVSREQTAVSMEGLSVDVSEKQRGPRAVRLRGSDSLQSLLTNLLAERGEEDVRI